MPACKRYIAVQRTSHMRCVALQAIIWALLAGGAAAWGWGGPPAPRFAVVPASSLRDGEGERWEGRAAARKAPQQRCCNAAPAAFLPARLPCSKSAAC